jgi:hypothetical protein
MAIQALSAPSLAAAALVANAPQAVAAKPTATPAAKQPAATNDADGDLRSDLASGENAHETLGSKVNVQA